MHKVGEAGYRREFANKIVNRRVDEKSIDHTQIKHLRQELILLEKAKEAPFRDSDPNLGFYLLELNQKNRKAFVGENPVTDMYTNIIRSIGKDAIVGRERFFPQPNYWHFDCEKPIVLIRSLEFMKAAGITSEARVPCVPSGSYASGFQS